LVDQPCDPFLPACADGLDCELTGVVDGGEIGVCHAPVMRLANQPCFNQTCGAGLWCDRTSSVVGVCRAVGTAGQACDVGLVSCSSGLVCDGSKKQCVTPGVDGGACSAEWPATCASGFGCGANMTCEPKVATGMSCDSSLECPSTDYCDGTCKPSKLPGAPCTGKDNECIGGACDTIRLQCNGDCVDPG
jgi:hypothetical protein